MKTNEDLKVEMLSNHLSGKTIALCISGGIAAIETPKLARRFRRIGAKINIYATATALKFIGKASLEWASTQPVTVELSGMAEHICQEDIVLVAPATLNTINKIFAGIADSPVTTLIASALGKKIPVFIAPTMHMSLYNNPILQKNLQNNAYGIHLIPARFEEDKAKIPDLETIVTTISDFLLNAASIEQME